MSQFFPKPGAHKLKAIPFDVSKLRNVVKNDVVKGTVYDELVKKVNAIQAIDKN